MNPAACCVPVEFHAREQIVFLGGIYFNSYPSELIQLDFDPPQRITPKGYFTDAKYVSESEPGLHLVYYYPGPRPVKSHDGLSGAPWLVDDRRTNEWQHKLAGVHVQGNMKIGRFIGANVLVGMLSTL
jgi:hypothetical protein